MSAEVSVPELELASSLSNFQANFRSLSSSAAIIAMDTVCLPSSDSIPYRRLLLLSAVLSKSLGMSKASSAPSTRFFTACLISPCEVRQIYASSSMVYPNSNGDVVDADLTSICAEFRSNSTCPFSNEGGSKGSKTHLFNAPRNFLAKWPWGKCTGSKKKQEGEFSPGTSPMDLAGIVTNSLERSGDCFEFLSLRLLILFCLTCT
mmetsp:Transcript_28525/g.59975  ORF Transcript_28525/g.59975 Transcript_28525/m.59975 type:complete len:205 (-) Transcript_28525:357-971(-)